MAVTFTDAPLERSRSARSEFPSLSARVSGSLLRVGATERNNLQVRLSGDHWMIQFRHVPQAVIPRLLTVNFPPRAISSYPYQWSKW